MFRNAIDYVFPNKSALDAIIEHFRHQFQILRQQLPIHSNSKVCRSASRSKYQEIEIFDFFIDYVFLIFRFRMKDLSILDLNNGFHTKNCPYR